MAIYPDYLPQQHSSSRSIVNLALVGLERGRSKGTGLSYAMTGGGEQASSSGSKLVLLHGIGNSLRYWEEMVVAIPPDRQALLIDLPGFGGSDWVPSEGFQDQSRRISETIRELGFDNDVVVVAHSLGSFFALEVAIQLGEVVRQVVLIDGTLARAFDILVSGSAASLNRPALAAVVFAQFLGGLIPFQGFLAELLSRSSLLRRVALWPYVSNPAGLDPESLRRVLAGNGGPRATLDVLREARFLELELLLQGVETRVSSVRGENDRLIDDSDVAFYKTHLKEFGGDHKLSETGHWPMLESPDLLAECLCRLEAW